MASLIESVKVIIDAIPGSASRFPGQVWTRPIIPADATGPDGILWAETPEAFDPNVPIQILRCVSLHQPPRISSGTNWPDQYYDFVETWYYGPDTDEDRVLLEQSMETVRNALRNRPVSYVSGTGKIIPSNDRTPIQPTGEFFHAVYGVERFYVVSYEG